MNHSPACCALGCAVAAVLAVLLTGCSMVTTRILPTECLLTDVERETWAGAWVADDQSFQIHFRRDGRAVMASTDWDDTGDAFKLTTHVLYFHKLQENLYVVFVPLAGDKKEAGYVFGKLLLLPDSKQAVVYMPEIGYFRDLVAGQKLAGTVSKGKGDSVSVELNPDREKLEQALPAGGAFDTLKPLLLRRLK